MQHGRCLVDLDIEITEVESSKYSTQILEHPLKKFFEVKKE